MKHVRMVMLAPVWQTIELLQNDLKLLHGFHPVTPDTTIFCHIHQEADPYNWAGSRGRQPSRRLPCCSVDERVVDPAGLHSGPFVESFGCFLEPTQNTFLSSLHFLLQTKCSFGTWLVGKPKQDVQYRIVMCGAHFRCCWLEMCATLHNNLVGFVLPVSQFIPVGLFPQ